MPAAPDSPGRPRATLSVRAELLVVTEMTPRGRVRHEWRRQEIAAIRCGSADWHDRSRKELQVYLRDGRLAGILRGRETDELRWLATVLRQAL